MNHIDLHEAKEVYKKGENVTQYLRKKFDLNENTSEIIEIAYDLQAGSYVEFVEGNREKVQLYTDEIASILNQQIKSGDSLLDVGTGELTTLTMVLNRIDKEVSNVSAFDISWSRLKKGLKFYKENIKRLDNQMNVFVADMKQIPLHGKSVDIVTSSHALEPNGKNLSILLEELFRITKRKLVLFEPSYELNSDEGRERMDRLGYIKDIENKVVQLGGKVLEIIPILNVANPLNPTACYIIEPPVNASEISIENPALCVPGTNFKLHRVDSFLESKETGLVFPVLDDIPILRSKASILASAKF